MKMCFAQICAALLLSHAALASEPVVEIVPQGPTAVHAHGAKGFVWVSRWEKSGVMLGRLTAEGQIAWDPKLSVGLPPSDHIALDRIDFPHGTELGARAVYTSYETHGVEPRTRIVEYAWDGTAWSLYAPAGPRDTPGVGRDGVTWEWAPAGETKEARLMRVKVDAETDPDLISGRARFDYAHCALHPAYWVGVGSAHLPAPPSGSCVRDAVMVQGVPIWVLYTPTGQLKVWRPVGGGNVRGQIVAEARSKRGALQCWYTLERTTTFYEGPKDPKSVFPLELESTEHCVDARGNWRVEKKQSLRVQGGSLVATEGGGGIFGDAMGSMDRHSRWTRSSTAPSIYTVGGKGPSRAQWLRDAKGNFAWPTGMWRVGGYTWVLAEPGWSKHNHNEASDDPKGDVFFRVANPAE